MKTYSTFSEASEHAKQLSKKDKVTTQVVRHEGGWQVSNPYDEYNEDFDAAKESEPDEERDTREARDLIDIALGEFDGTGHLNNTGDYLLDNIVDPPFDDEYDVWVDIPFNESVDE